MVWFRKASEQGHPHSAYNLAVGHFTGIKTGAPFVHKQTLKNGRQIFDRHSTRETSQNDRNADEVTTEQGVVQMSVGEVVVDEMTWYLFCFLCPLEFFDRWIRDEFG